jgi:hypothetical protein
MPPTMVTPRDRLRPEAEPQRASQARPSVDYEGCNHLERSGKLLPQEPLRGAAGSRLLLAAALLSGLPRLFGRRAGESLRDCLDYPILNFEGPTSDSSFLALCRGPGWG